MIEQGLVDLESTDIDALQSFYKMYQNEIVKYFFVFYMCSLNKNNRTITILIRKIINGATNDQITQDLNDNVAGYKDAKLKILGIYFDQNPGYLSYLEEDSSIFVR